MKDKVNKEKAIDEIVKNNSVFSIQWWNYLEQLDKEQLRLMLKEANWYKHKLNSYPFRIYFIFHYLKDLILDWFKDPKNQIIIFT